MLNSMTGHGDASVLDKAFELAVEARSVNSRYLRVSCKVGEEIAFVHMPVEEEVKRQVSRGSVFVTVNFKPVSSADYYSVDEPVLTKYFRQLRELSQDLQTGEGSSRIARRRRGRRSPLTRSRPRPGGGPRVLEECSSETQ